MTHIEQAIREAVEKGGFKPFASIVPPQPWISEKMDFDTLAIYDGDPETSARRGSIGIARTLINPAFWQALGKARGWADDDELMLLSHEESSHFWKYEWHRLIDHLAEGKDAESFFADLFQ